MKSNCAACCMSIWEQYRSAYRRRCCLRCANTSVHRRRQPTRSSNRVIADYLEQFVDGLKHRGIAASFFVMLSEGGMASPDIVRRLAVRIL